MRLLRPRDKAEQAPDTPEEEPEVIIGSFEAEIEQQESLLYGVALFFEGISLLFSGQEAVVETYRKQFRNIIQMGKDAVMRARELAEEAKRDPGKITLVKRFQFLPCQGHPDPDTMAERARILVATYEELFPDRPRDRGLAEAETLQLMEAAGKKIDLTEAS